MKRFCFLSLFVLLFAASCKNAKPTTAQEIPASESFYPMQIGNSWKINDQNYTEIQDTLTINNKLYYKIYSLIGGDASSVQYLRVDENNQLLEAFPDDTTQVYLHAKFDANVNDEFNTLNDKSVNDYKVKLITKTSQRRTFEFDMVNQPNLAGSKHTVSYLKGQGPDGIWETIRINGVDIK